ncbi:MAG: ATP-binding protein, partial [Caldilineaceae bacterium]
VLVDLHWPDSLYAQVEPQLRFENTLTALKTLILAESLHRPVILHLEDAHWLDADSQTLLARLTHKVADYPLAIIVTRRPEAATERQEDKKTGRQEDEAADSLSWEGPQVLIQLTTLSADEIRALAAAQLQGEPTPALVTLIEERAEGNPFFAEQLLRYLQEQEWLVQGVDGWQLRADQATTTLLPSGARALLVARLDQLPQPVKEVVQTAAVLGREFDTNVLAQMLADDQTLAAKLAVADRAAIWSAVTQARYLFRHALLRAAAYDMQLRARLRLLHHRAGAALEQVYRADLTPYFGELAYHYDQAEAVDQAVRWYGQAGTKALDHYANQEALRYFKRALVLPAVIDDETRYQLLLGREAAESWLGQRTAQVQALEELEALTVQQTDRAKQATVALRRAAYASQIGQRQMALHAAETAVRYTSEAGNPLLEAQAYHRWGRVCWESGDYGAAQRHLAQGLQVAQAQKNLLMEAQCLYDLGTAAYYIDDYSSAQDYLQKAAQTYGILQDRQGEIRCLSLAGMIMDNLGDHGNALQQYEQALHLAQTVGWRYAEARLLNQSGDNLLQLGALSASRQRLERALVICREIDDQATVASTLDMLGLVAFAEGQLTAAKSCFTDALAIVQMQNNRRSQGYTLTHLGYVLSDLGEYDLALGLLQQALALRTEEKVHGLQVDTLAALAHLRLLQGELGHAHQYVREILRWIEQHGVTGFEFPIQVYLHCYTVLDALGKRDQHIAEQAKAVLAAGHALLMARASRLQSEQLRQQFLDNLAFNRQLYAFWLAHSMTI